jgi:hypothetical protein
MSELQLRNNQVDQDLTVTPVLRTADGAETALAPVTIKPQEVKAIDLEAALATTAPQMIGTYGSVVLRYHSTDAANLYPVVMIRNIGHPFAFHVDGSGETEAYQAASREGIWWLPNDTASDYLVLTNQGKNPLSLDLSLFDTRGRESRQKLALGPRATSRLSVRQLLRAAGLTGSYGGIKVFAAAHAGSLDTLHVLFDEKASFSAILKMFDHDPSATLKQRDHARTGVWTLRAPMLALSNPDPALRFPPGTLLRPQLFIRNTIGKPVDAALRFNWRADTTTGKAAGPTLHLNPHETRLIDVAALQEANVLRKEAHWASVTLTTNGLPDEVMAVAASYDQTLQYGAQTPFSDQLARRWEGSAWEYDPQHDSIISAGNGGTKPIQAAFTIFYNQGRQKYELEQTLHPDEQMWLYIGKLIREHLPDKNGNTLPENLTSGSFAWQDLTSKAIGTLFEGKIVYDKTYGHVAYGCAACCGYNDPHFSWNPLGVPLSLTAGNTVIAHDACTGFTEDVSDAFYQHWSTANTSIATVNGTGVHSGISVGSTTSDTYGDLQSNLRTLQCPINTYYPNGGDSVFCATPTNFAIHSETPLSDGSLFFTYTWSSSTGNQADLGACTVGESVFYPGYPTTPYIYGQFRWYKALPTPRS